MISLVLLFGIFLSLEFNHLHRYGHLVPLSLHADVFITTSNALLGVEGAGKIYHAALTNYGFLSAAIVGCDYRVSGAPETQINYVVERWDSQSDAWKIVPEWDFYGYRLFCRPAFEVSDEHRVRHRLWPGESIQVGEGVPAQIGGFHVGDSGRFTIFLGADADRHNALSTAIFRVDQEPKTGGMPTRFSR